MVEITLCKSKPFFEEYFDDIPRKGMDYNGSVSVVHLILVYRFLVGAAAASVVEFSAADPAVKLSLLFNVHFFC